MSLSELSVDGLDPPYGALVSQQLVAPGRDRPDVVLAVTDLLAIAIINEPSPPG